MGFYSKYIFPRLLEFSLSKPFISRLRRDLLSKAGGEVLEIGFGTGLNIPHYPDHVGKVITVDPNPGMNNIARRRIDASAITVEHHQLRAERLPFGDETFDTVV